MLKRIRRYIPPAEVLAERLNFVFDHFGSKLDYKSGKPLFDEAAWKEVRSLMKHVHRGCLSDPVGVGLYMPLGKDRNGLMVYHCSRGTSDVEG